METLSITVMKTLAYIGACYRSDLVKYVSYKTAGGVYANKIVKKMEDDGLIARKEVFRSKRGNVEEMNEVSMLTKKGRLEILNWLYDKKENEELEYLHKHIDEFRRDFNSATTEKSEMHLLESRMKLMFMNAGVAVLQKDKPALLELYCKLKRDDSYIFGMEEMYSNLFTTEDCEQLMKDGVLYTMNEYRSFVDEVEDGEGDKLYVSRARGIFLSQNNLYIVYMTKKSQSAAISVKPNGERNLLRTLDKLESITNVKREVENMTRTYKDDYGNAQTTHYQNDIDAIVLTGMDSLVSAMANQGKGGRTSENNDSSGKREMVDVWISSSTTLYNRVYVIPQTTEGINALAYICSTPLEQTHEEATNLLNSSPAFHLTENDSQFPADEFTNEGMFPATYVPAYEVKLLRRLYETDGVVAVITYPDMYEQIAKCIRKPVHFYNADTMERVLRDEVCVYNKRGDIGGVAVITARLKEQGYTVLHKTIEGMYRASGMTKPEFFNKIYYGELDVDEMIRKYIQETSKKQIVVKEKTRRKTKDKRKVATELDVALIPLLKKAGKAKGKSVNKYVAWLVESSREQIEHDAEIYDRGLEKFQED